MAAVVTAAGSLQKTFERDNDNYKGLEWELEDLLPEDFVKAFLAEYPEAVSHSSSVAGKVHRNFTQDGKARFHRFIKENAMHADISAVVTVLKALRFYLNLRTS